MRFSILQRIMAVAVVLLWGGLFTTQIVQGQRFKRQAERNRTRLIHLPAPRGVILDRRGVALGHDQLSFELAVFPQEMKDPSATWQRLSQIVNVPASELQKRYRLSYQAPFSLVTLVKDLDPKTAFLLEERKQNLPGVVVRPIPQRRYPLGSAVGAVVGYIGLIAPEELTHLKQYGYTYRDRVGKDGLEQQYDRTLRGRDGGLSLEVDARGRMVRQVGYLAPRPGRAIKVSIDSRLQDFCYRLLGDSSGAIVVMEVESGQILALTSAPGFDPNLFLDSTRREELRRTLGHSSRPLFNRATRAAVAPGSTFKVATAYEALALKRISSHTAFDCAGSYSVGTSVFHCWKEEGHGSLTVAGALEHSCNVFFYQTGRRLRADGIAQAAHLFGLGRPTGIDLPREGKGTVPDSEWMVQRYKQKWQEGDTISFAIGQGPLQVTPLQMLQLTNAVASNGKVPTPHLLLEIEEEGGVRHLKNAQHHLDLDQEALAVVKLGLKEVVTSSAGTGRLAQQPGVALAGKTGTAQNPGGIPHAWFVGYAPDVSAKISFVIFLEHGGQGGVQAALAARDLVAYLKELDYL